MVRRRCDPRQAGLVDCTDDDPRTIPRSRGGSTALRPTDRGRELVGWTLSPRYYEIVAWRGPKGHRQHRTQRASTLEQARDMARDAIRWDGWDGAWIFPSET